MIQKLMVYSGGLTGLITVLFGQEAELAIRLKTESISLALLDQVASVGIFKLPVAEEVEGTSACNRRVGKPGDKIKGALVVTAG